MARRRNRRGIHLDVASAATLPGVGACVLDARLTVRVHAAFLLAGDDDGDLRGVQDVEVKMKPARCFTPGHGGYFGRSPRLRERRSGPRHQRSRRHGAGRVFPRAPPPGWQHQRPQLPRQRLAKRGAVRRRRSEVVERIGALGTPLAAIAVELMQCFTSTYKVTSGFDSPPVHDPCCIARIIDPKLVECVATYVTVETHGTTTSGMTSVDFDNRFGREPNALVATKLDFDGFWNLMLDAIGRIG